MKLELKNVKIHPDISEETTCFSATLWVDGKRAASCRNDGRGGSTDVFFFEGNRSDLATKVYQYCEENPVVIWAGEKNFILPNVSDRVDELLAEYQQRKMIKKDQKRGLILHKKDSKDPDYAIHATWEFGSPIKSLMQTELGRRHLKIVVIQCQNEGYEIMNNNIEFKELGL